VIVAVRDSDRAGRVPREQPERARSAAEQTAAWPRWGLSTFWREWRWWPGSSVR